MSSVSMCAARVEAFGKSVHAFDRRVSSCVGFRGGTRGLGGFSKPTPTKARVSVTGTRPRNNRLVVRADENGQDAYNKAMAEYSKTPFEYRHELGLCKCPIHAETSSPRTHLSLRVAAHSRGAHATRGR
jgi:hypothetical protein